MLTFVVWKSKRAGERADGLDPDRVGERLRSVFSPVFEGPPAAVVRSAGSAHLAFLELPIKGWRPGYFASDGKSWALAGDYPLNARTVLASRGIPTSMSETLPTLGAALERDPEPLLKDLTPPFSLIWSPAPAGGRDEGAGRATYIHNDGLGQAQLFAYEDDEIWAVTNRIFALEAVGVTLEPDAEAWAARFAISWFPLDLTGYKNVRLLAPGTRVRLDDLGVHESRHDVISDWVHPPARSREDCLELGLHSLRSIFEESMQHWECPTVGLSGGWDSRALTSILRSLDAEVSLRVRGSPGRYDVMISTELARIADLHVRVKNEGGYPPEDTAGMRRSISQALVWQGGHMSIPKHKTFLARKDYLDGGVVNVMGQHGGFGKADFAVKTGAADLDPSQYENRLVEVVLKKMPPFMRPEMQDRVRDLVVQSYRQADSYGVEGLARLHFYFMYEYTRRWASATLSSQPGLVIAPYLSPDFIRACYGFPLEEIPVKPFHSYITGKLAPDWSDVLYEDQVTDEDVESGRLQPVKLKSRKRRVHEQTKWKVPRKHKKFSTSLYWRTIGEPLIAEAFEQGGFWTAIMDRDLARKTWDERPGKVAPDAIAIGHVLPSVIGNS